MNFMRLSRYSLIMALFFGVNPTMAMSAEIKAPQATLHNHAVSLHGDTRQDPYHWLKNVDDPQVITHLNAENSYTETKMQSTKNLQAELYQDLVGRIVETDQSVPRQKGDYFYYSRTEKGLNYPIYCRRKGSMQAPEEILLDQNTLAKGHEYFSLGVFQVSPDHRYLAYSVDTSGAEEFTLYIVDLNTQQVQDTIPGTYYSVEWANDNRHLFYTTLDAAHRPYRFYRHVLGSNAAQDTLLYEEKDERFNAAIAKTASDSYLLFHLESLTTSESHYLNANQPEGSLTLIQARQAGLEYQVEHNTHRFFVLTNDQARNFRIMEAPVNQPDKSHWKEVIPAQEHSKLEDMRVFENYLVYTVRRNASLEIHAQHLITDERWQIALPEKAVTVSLDSEQDFKSNRLRFDYATMLTPWSVFEYTLPERQLTLRKQQAIPDYHPERYVFERLEATAADGTSIPISLIYRKGLKKDGQNPTLLYSYGSYGSSMDPDFSSYPIALLERGFIYAIAHIRGGEDKGREWYEQGKMLNKKNTFNDFIACAEHLIKTGYTQPSQLAIEGGSAGGLLMGAVTNLRPDLFQAVIAEVPFVDVINTMLDPSLPLTVIEYEEWGNPNEKVYYDYMKSYAPYENIESKAYPHMLVTAGLNDPRVGYWEPAKWVARLRERKTDQNQLLLKVNMGAGHSGASGRYEYLKEVAFNYAFILQALSTPRTP